MCGIVGLVTPGRAANPQLLHAMADQLRHRGPDDAGVWHQESVGFGHRRLSIVDLSSAGHQPILSACGRWVMSYNGEIYNGNALRTSIEGMQWRGHSDSEVLIEAIARWGVISATQKIIGMFAFAAYNLESKELWLVRDRLGIKPLYYGWVGQDFVFASELSALKPLPERPEVSTSAVRSYLRHGVVPAPYSIYQGINKLLPGSCIKLDVAQLNPGELPECSHYWSLQNYAQPVDLSEAEAADELQSLLRTAVKDRLMADVPLGAFLSGGYDSSLVCALMQEQSPQPLKTFTIGFDNPAYNEAPHAKRIAHHLGTDHTELVMSEADVLESVDRLPALCDEPFADQSILPTYLVSALARQHVTVSLSGDGGDELFWGYPRYQMNQKIWRRLAAIPRPLRQLGAQVAGHPLTQRLTHNIRVGSRGGRPGTLNQKLARSADVLSATSSADLYQTMRSQWSNPDLLLHGEDLPDVYNTPDHWTRQLSDERRMAAQDLLAYLPNDILTKVDRASMAVSLEARVPLLDHRVVEFAMQLPDALKRNGNTTKYLLKQVTARYIPAQLTERPKMGFSVPLAQWLRGPLREWSEDLLCEETLTRHGLLKEAPVTQLWQSHLRQDSDNATKLWYLLMLNQWMETSKS